MVILVVLPSTTTTTAAVVSGEGRAPETPVKKVGENKFPNWTTYYKTIHSSCEIEDFVETHICKLCVILRSRVLRGVCSH